MFMFVQSNKKKKKVNRTIKIPVTGFGHLKFSVELVFLMTSFRSNNIC